MEKSKNIFVSNLELQYYLSRVKFGGITSEKMSEYCDYLDGKVIREIDKSAQHVFLSQTTVMGAYSPYYTSETEKYIKSKAFSDKMKKWILKTIKRLDGLDKLRELLKSNLDINDFDKDALFDIEKALTDVKSTSSDEEDLLPLFERYMFALDGNGPCSYIKHRYNDKDLAKMFLANSNIDVETEVGNGLLVEYMMSIYRMYKKYLSQEYIEKYLKFIKAGNFLSQKEFSKGYESFVNSGFKVKSDVKHSVDKNDEIERENNISRITTKKIFMSSLDSLQTEEPLESVVKRLIYTIDSQPEKSRNQQTLDKIA